MLCAIAVGFSLLVYRIYVSFLYQPFVSSGVELEFYGTVHCALMRWMWGWVAYGQLEGADRCGLSAVTGQTTVFLHRYHIITCLR